MGLPTDMSRLLHSPISASAALPTPAQTPPTEVLNSLPTGRDESYDGMFDLDAHTPEMELQTYTDFELQAAIDNPSREALIRYDNHTLNGQLYYLPSLFFQSFEHFLDICPQDEPPLAQTNCEPWVLYHATLGRTWVHKSVLDSCGLCTQSTSIGQPRFAAITDNPRLLYKDLSSPYLYVGHVTLHGDYTVPELLDPAKDIILAMPCSAPLTGFRKAPKICPKPVRATQALGHVPHQLHDAVGKADSGHRLHQSRIDVKDYTPAPASSATLATVRRILDATQNCENMSSGGVKRQWLTTNMSEHLALPPVPVSDTSPHARPASKPTRPQLSTHTRPTAVLSPASSLWPHRGNEALFKRGNWQSMCYTTTQSDWTVEDKGGVKVPEPYWQVLFEDLQARERVSGTEQLAAVDRKYYESVSEEKVAALADAVGELVGRAEEENRGEDYDRESMEVD